MKGLIAVGLIALVLAGAKEEKKEFTYKNQEWWDSSKMPPYDPPSGPDFTWEYDPMEGWVEVKI